MPVTAIAHPNVALVKYWGKRDGGDNRPATPSLSITLAGLCTRTTVTTDPQLTADRVVLDGKVVEDPKINSALARLKQRANTPPNLLVTTTNDFPTAAGLASSASGFAALVMAVNGALKLDMTNAECADEARRASASAARSLLGGFVTLIDDQPAQLAQATDWPLSCVVAVCAEGPKPVSSGAGMRASRATSPFYSAWVDTSLRDFDSACRAVRERDFDALADIAEANCLAMHAVMLSTRPPLIYWNDVTVAVIHAVRALRAEGVPVFFTIDAGPQVKAVCLPESKQRVEDAILSVPGVYRIIAAHLGEGARIEAAA